MNIYNKLIMWLLFEEISLFCIILSAPLVVLALLKTELCLIQGVI